MVASVLCKSGYEKLGGSDTGSDNIFTDLPHGSNWLLQNSYT
jgi:hypothetical protein